MSTLSLSNYQINLENKLCKAILYWGISQINALLLVGITDLLMLLIIPEIYSSIEVFFISQCVLIGGSYLGTWLYSFCFVIDDEYDTLGVHLVFAAVSSIVGMVLTSIAALIVIAYLLIISCCLFCLIILFITNLG